MKRGDERAGAEPYLSNYIPSSERARREYSYLLLKEYRKYIKDKADSSG